MSAQLYRSSGKTMVRFSLPRHDADEVVSVVGSFNDWVPGVHVLQPSADGMLKIVAAVEHAGDVHFRYLATGGRWFDDPDADVIDEYGSTLRRPADDSALPTEPGDGVGPTAPATPKTPAAKKAAAKKVAATKAPAKKAPATKAPAKKAPATKAPAKKAPAKKVAAAAAPADADAPKAPAKKAPSKKAPAKKAPAKKAPAKKAPAKKAAAPASDDATKTPAKKAVKKAVKKAAKKD